MTQVRTTKTKTYIKFNGVIFMTNNDWENKTFTIVDMNTIQDQQRAALNSEFGWEELGEHATIEDAYYAFIGAEIARKNERKIKNDIFTAKYTAERNAAWEAIKNLSPIPATIENIRTVLLHLNDTNWGGWTLPKMSISYTAAQYDCDGVQASTMKFDQAIDGEKLFKVGGKSGHLNKYQQL